MTEVAIAREDLERLCSAATAFVAMQRVAERGGTRMPEVSFSIDGGREQIITAGAMARELPALERAVVRTRRLLGWRRR